jgi:hypothetical protein
MSLNVVRYLCGEKILLLHQKCCCGDNRTKRKTVQLDALIPNLLLTVHPNGS